MVKVVYEAMTPQEFLKYATSHPWLEGELDTYRQYQDHPICPGCEGIALRDKGWKEEKWSQCPRCHRRFKADINLYDYVKEQLYRR